MTETAKKAAAPKPQAEQAPEAPAHDNLAAALAAFQADMPTVHKGQAARIPGKNGGPGYSYQYADLADVAKVAHPLLARHGLSFTTAPQHLEGVGFVLQGTLRHTSGQQDVGILPITGRSAQDLGSSLTYLRRYLLGCMTGIVTDEDEDGTLAESQGAARPQASTPPAYSPEHVQRLQSRLAGLNHETTAKVREWWAVQNLPSLSTLDESQAESVHSYLDQEGHPSANPQ